MSALQNDSGEAAGHSDYSKAPHANNLIFCYLMERCSEFRELADVRRKGWTSPEGDEFFEKQRRVADKSDAKTRKHFYFLMQRIGIEINRETAAFKISRSGQGSILDLCMAPGGFVKIALDLNPGSCALGFSLPISNGGHKALIPRDMNVTTRFLDVTMLAEDMGVKGFPDDHPDAKNFLPQVFKAEESFDIVLCDGQVLRTHARATYRERREARRLTATQLALVLDHIRTGGTMIVLLHRVESWDTVYLLYRFSKFSSVELFKPTAGHRKRSSFYLVAGNVQSAHAEAVGLVASCKMTWKVATFGTDEEYVTALHVSQSTVEDFLRDFGPELVQLGRAIWDVQAKALAEAPFIRDS